jgi:hypothetical protein
MPLDAAGAADEAQYVPFDGPRRQRFDVAKGHGVDLGQRSAAIGND